LKDTCRLTDVGGTTRDGPCVYQLRGRNWRFTCFSREDPPKIVEIPAILIYFAGYEWDKDWKDRDENWGMIMNYWDMIV
jgi:hypothetical protein